MGVFSVIFARPDLRMWLPYKNDISADDFSHTCTHDALLDEGGTLLLDVHEKHEQMCRGAFIHATTW